MRSKTGEIRQDTPAQDGPPGTGQSPSKTAQETGGDDSFEKQASDTAEQAMRRRDQNPG